MVHGDDFIAVGYRDRVETFRNQIANRFTVKDKIIGLREDLGELREARVLNRILRVRHDGWEYEADQRHADLIVSELGLGRARSAKTPGEEEPTWKMQESDQPLDRSLTTKYRGLAARANYLAADRVDIQFAVKECCRGMAAPEQRHWEN